MVAHHRCHLCKGGFCTGAHACAHRCFHLRSSFFTLCCLIHDKHFSQHGTVNSCYGPLGLCCGATLVLWCKRPLRDEWGNVGVNGRTLAVNYVRIHYGNFVARQTNSGVRRLGSQLPIAPTPNRVREKRLRPEIGEARSRATKSCPSDPATKTSSQTT